MTVVFPVSVFIAEYHRNNFISTIEERLFRIFRKVLKWFGEVPVFVTGSHELSLLYHVLHALPGYKPALSDRIIRIDGKLFRKVEMDSEPRTVGTCAVRVVEGK